MAETQIAGDGVPPSLAGMSKSQLYEIMCQMKALIEQNEQQAREILIQNPVLTRALFQAQILLGMVQPRQTSALSSSVSQNSQPAMLTQQSNTQTTSPFSGPIGHNQVRKQQSDQEMTSKPLSESIPPTNLQSQPISSQSSQPIQQPKVHLGSQSMPASTSQLSQVPNLTSVLQYTVPPSSSLPQSPIPMTLLPSQSQQALQNPGGQYLPLQPPLQASQPPLPPLPRPQIPAFPHQGHGQMGLNLGFQHPGGQQMHHHSQTMYHTATVGPAGLGPSVLLGQPALPKPLHSSPYLAGGPPLGMEFNQVGSSNQTDRGSNWMPGMPEIKGAHFPGPPLVSNQMVPSSQPPPSALTPEMEKALLQQVMSLTPEQIIMLPPEQRNQILQLQQLLRQ